MKELLSKVNDKHNVVYRCAYVLLQEYLATRAKLFDPTKTNPEVVHVSVDTSAEVVHYNKCCHAGQPNALV